MKIAIFSDTHFGYGWGTERQEDSFVQAREALEKAVSRADLILIAGDVFDTRAPRQEVVREAMKVFAELKTTHESQAKLVEIKDLMPQKAETDAWHAGSVAVYPVHKLGVPIVAIHGTHDRRGRGLVNPVKILEEAGYLIQLDGQVAVFEKAGERVAILGVSGVPEMFARQRFRELKAKPLPGATNILMLHQSLAGFVYMDDDNPTLTVEDLPKSFDLIVNGHIHWSSVHKMGITDLLLTGSTITTQVRSGEAEVPKKIWWYDTKTKMIEEEVLQTPRKVFYLEIEGSGKAADILRKEIEALLASVPSAERKPLVRVRIKGEGLDEFVAGQTFSDVVESFKGSLLLTIRNDLKSESTAAAVKKARDLLEERVSIEELGLRLLRQAVQKENLSFRADEVFDLLADGEVDAAEEALLKGETTIVSKDETIEDVKKVAFQIAKRGQNRLF